MIKQVNQTINTKDHSHDQTTTPRPLAGQIMGQLNSRNILCKPQVRQGFAL